MTNTDADGGPSAPAPRPADPTTHRIGDVLTDPAADRRRAVLAAGALLLSVAAMGVFLIVTASDYYLGDLRVFVSAPGWAADGRLYEAVTRTGDGSVTIPYLYPPWVALAFAPLSVLPFALVAVLWTVAGVTALVVSVLLLSSLLSGRSAVRDPHLLSSAAWWSAGLLWIAPVRHCLYEGQLSLLLLCAVVVAVWSARPVAGVLAGPAAAAKIVPVAAFAAVGSRGRGRLLWACAGAVVPITVGWVVFPGQSRDYFLGGVIMEGADRVGGVATVANQSLRAALSRFAGGDVGFGPLWIAGAALLIGSAALVVARFRHDRVVLIWVPAAVAAALFPLGWSHQWIWLVPLLMWLRTGPLGDGRFARALVVLWFIGLAGPVIEVLLFVQRSNYVYARPLWQSVAGAAYPIGLLTTLLALSVIGRADHRATAVSGEGDRRSTAARGVPSGPAGSDG